MLVLTVGTDLVSIAFLATKKGANYAPFFVAKGETLFGFATLVFHDVCFCL